MVATLSDSPPSAYIAQGVYTGFDNELLRVAARYENIDLSFVGTDFAGLLSGIAVGRFDIGSATISSTEARKKTVSFTNGYHVGITVVVTAKGARLTTPNALSGKRLGVVQGTLQEEYAQKIPGAKVVRFPDSNSAAAQLKSGALDGWVATQAVGTKYVKQAAPSALEIGYSVAAKEAPSAFAVRIGDKTLVSELNDGISRSINDGTVVRLYKRFFPAEVIPPELEPGGGGYSVSP
ncbi:ABC transporter substrate-binding protein [Amycolatopsis sp.]|uniref:substrate-binding periplasmic protein n=1 Tax=Amycolatopsis sp. TaxID=37632 RepID=UPI002621A851|nr:ABC transporter substrate-binding protein [Amycolatopsis sp.]